MQRTRWHRLQALFLLLAVIGGGFGLPVFDAVVFHGRPLAPTESSVAPEGAPAQHTQLCILDQASLLEGGMLSRGHAPLAPLPVAAALAGTSGTAVLLTAASLLPPSRAPPSV